MAGFGRIVLVGVTLAVGLGAAALRAQTALEDPRNAPKIFANTCSACHKSPQGLAKSGGTASFLRQHYTTGPEMSAAMAAYLASAGNAPSKKNEKQKEAAKETPGQKRTAGHPLTDGSTDVPQRPSAREKQKTAKGGEPKQGGHAAARPPEPPSAPERPDPSAPASTTAALSAPAPSAQTAEPAATPTITLDLPLPQYPSEAPADFVQPPVFSSAPLP